MDGGEDRGAGANGEPKRQHDDQGKAGTSHEPAPGEAEIDEHVGHVGWPGC
jgi:hypothetical protein